MKGDSVVQCAVFGASGYSGAELVALLARHPDARVASVHADTHAGERWEDLYPGRRHLYQGDIQAADPGAASGCDVAFLALPHGVSGAMADRLRGQVPTIIDLSGDLRLSDASVYERWYGRAHPAPGLVGHAVYGLPELFEDGLRGADLVACAGCYATVSQIAAAPALSLGDDIGSNLSISALSGTSGAGRKGDVTFSFSEVSGDLRAYRVGAHQHVPEIAGGLARHAGRPVDLTFVPHLVPTVRGIHATVVLPNPGGVDVDRLLQTYREAYASAPFVRVLDPRDRLPSVRDVVGTNFCDLAPAVDPHGRTVVVVGVIDNLLKGAAGQAVQVMNRILGLAETAGLEVG